MSHISSILSKLQKLGLNQYGVCSGENYTQFLPNCQSVIVIANAGRTLWEYFIADIQQNPHLFTEETDPLDRWIQNKIQEIDPNPPKTRRWIRCAANDLFVDFRPLALEAGLGFHSHLGLVLHPEYGLWISLRAAIFTTEYIKPSLKKEDRNPCSSCPKFCSMSCLGNAFTEKGWQVQKCASFHQNSNLCSTSCSARTACPIGKQYQHSELEHCYHSNQEIGRKRICQLLDQKDDVQSKESCWKDWIHNA